MSMPFIPKYPIKLLLDEGLYIGKYHMWTEEEWEILMRIVDTYEYKHPREAELIDIFFPVTPDKRKGITEADIAKAKEVPIDTLLTIKRHLTLCLWHSDTKPSAYYYEGKNKLHCFSCSRGADSIDVTMKLHGLSFSGAVNYLHGR